MESDMRSIVLLKYVVTGSLASTCVLAILLVSVTASLTAQQPQDISIAVVEPRPLASVVEQLEKRFGWVVTYEDPSYVHESEIADVTAAVSRNPGSSKKVFVPLGGSFAFRYQLSLPPQAQAPAVLAALIEQYNGSQLAGRFRLLTTDRTYHVLPAMAKDDLAALRPYRSILDATISIPDGDRNALEMLEAILNAVKATGDTRLAMGTVPMGLLSRTTVQGGAKGEAARVVLLRTLQATNQKLSWQLFCHPGKTGPCALNIHVVPAAPTIGK